MTTDTWIVQLMSVFGRWSIQQHLLVGYVSILKVWTKINILLYFFICDFETFRTYCDVPIETLIPVACLFLRCQLLLYLIPVISLSETGYLLLYMMQVNTNSVQCSPLNSNFPQTYQICSNEFA